MTKTTVRIGEHKRRVGVNPQEAQDLVDAMLEHGLDSDQCMMLLFLTASGVHRVTSLEPDSNKRLESIVALLKQVYNESEKIHFIVDFHLAQGNH